MINRTMHRYSKYGNYSRWIWISTILLLPTLCVDAIVPSPEATKPQRCVYNKAYKMYGAHCSGLNLHAVPNTLKTSIEILDLSFNRIRDLKNTTFESYRYVKFLYLGDNMIQNIEAFAFEPLSSLEVLDLSLNSLRTVPSSVFNLPMLRKLYLADNALENFEDDMKKMEKPLNAPLKFLTMASCRLRSFPDFGVMPYLEHLNMSGNEFRNLTAGDFVKLCTLETVDLTGSYYPHDDICLNKPLVNWFVDMKIEMIPEILSIYNLESEDFKKCDETLTDDDKDKYKECQLKMKVRKQAEARQTWMIVGLSLGSFLLCAILFLYVVHRRNARKTKIDDIKKITETEQLKQNYNA